LAFTLQITGRFELGNREDERRARVRTREICLHCKGKIAVRNPKGFCDHLYYPDNCKVCKASAVIKRTERGFAVYASVKDSNGCEVRVQHSSADPLTFAYIFCTPPEWLRHTYKNPSPHLTVAQAKRVIAGLQKFVDGVR
jgi:hypothetical protein